MANNKTNTAENTVARLAYFRLQTKENKEILERNKQCHPTKDYPLAAAFQSELERQGYRVV